MKSTWSKIIVSLLIAVIFAGATFAGYLYYHRYHPYVKALSLKLEDNHYYDCTVTTTDARYLTTFADPDSNSPHVDFFALGDVGTGEEMQRSVAEQMAEHAQKDPISFILFLGDNFYPSGVSSTTDDQWESKFEAIYDQPSLQVPFYAVLGNHDYVLNPKAQIDYTKISPRWQMPNNYYDRIIEVDSGVELHLFGIDANMYHSNRTAFNEQMDWLDNRLDSSGAAWKLVYGHHPIHSGGTHGDSPFLIEHLKPILLKHDVDVYVSGHDHNLQLLKPTGNLHYVVSGAGGKDIYSINWDERMIFGHAGHGFAKFTAYKHFLQMDFINHVGKTAFSYTIRKVG